ncbi:MAG: gliding motility-associated C-terminal domain-containing protein [Candidatus Latescibacterota bacterium]
MRSTASRGPTVPAQRRGSRRWRGGALLCLGLALACSGTAGARQVLQLGGAGGRPWAGQGELGFVDAERVLGALRPLEADPSVNLVPGMAGRGGELKSIPDTYTLPQNWFKEKDLMVDGDSTSAFIHPPRIDFFRPGYFYSVAIFVDLGAPFPVERIRFATRPDHPENLVREYDLFVNDGSPASQTAFGDPVWTLIRREGDNLQRVVELNLERQPVRHVYLHPGSWGPRTANTGPGQTWEVAELEVYGRGFVPSSNYVSAPLDLGGPAALGEIRWAGHRQGRARVVVQTRSGSDADPELYWRRTGVGDQVSSVDTEGRPLTREAYLALPPSVRGGITQDLANWSVWHTYEFEDGLSGARTLSPSPRRFVQVRIQFLSDDLDGAQVDSLTLEYSQPPALDAAVGEIVPLTVEAGEPVRFTYAVRAVMGATQRGFDVLEVRTAALIDSVEQVRVDGAWVGFAAELDTATGHGFRVTFPRVAHDQSLLEVDFRGRVFRYGTPFNGAVSSAGSDEVALEVTPGDALPGAPGDGLKVRTSLEGAVLGSLSVGPNPFSPNGDGANDALHLACALRRLTGPAWTTVAIYDLAGRLVRTVGHGPAGSALLQVTWDGRDAAGRLVPPGSYVYRIGVASDSGEEARAGVIAVSY